MAPKREIDADTLEKAEALYAAYPLKRNRDKAIQAIAAALEEESFEVLLPLVRVYAESTIGKPKYFIPHATTWFNQRRWKLVNAPMQVRNMRDVDSVLAIARSQLATPDEAWSIVWQAAKRMETVTADMGGRTCKDSPENRRLAESVPEPARSVAMSIRWTNIRFGDEQKIRQEFCWAYREKVKAEVNRVVAPKLMGAVGLPGVERKRIAGE